MGCIEQPLEFTLTHRDHNCKIAAWNRVCDDLGKAVQFDVIHAETPDIIVYIKNVLLMGLWGKQAGAEPFAIENLIDLFNLFQLVYHWLHLGAFSWPILYPLGSIRFRAACVYVTGIISDRNTHSFWSKNWPKLDNQLS